MSIYLFLTTTPPVAPPANEADGQISEVFWVAVIGLVGTLIAGLLGPWVQSIATRRAEKTALFEREKLEFTRSVIDDLGQIAEVDRHESPEEWQAIYARIARTVTNLELILPRGEREIAAVILTSTMFLDPGVTPLEKSCANLNQFALLTRIKGWHSGETKAEGLLDDAIGATMAIRESLLRGDMKPMGEPLRDDQLSAEELEERVALGVSFPPRPQDNQSLDRARSGLLFRLRKHFSPHD